MMRLLAFMGFILGMVVAVWGLILFTGVVKSVLSGVSEGIGLIGSIAMVIGAGLALAGGGEALKVIQQRSEVRETITITEGSEEHTREVVVDSSGNLGTGGDGGGGR